MTQSPAGTRDDSGYALLALLASSAILLAGLALSLPRLVMQSQRTSEEVLIQRGKDYERAIELYFRRHKKYPAELEDLEETDGVRFLRRRHEDPMGETGEWRLIYMGTNGRFENSVLHDLEEEGAGLPGMLQVGIPGDRANEDQMEPPLDGGNLPIQGGAQQFAEEQDPREDPLYDPFRGATRARSVRESAAPDLAERDLYARGFGFDPNDPDVAQSDPDAEEPDGAADPQAGTGPGGNLAVAGPGGYPPGVPPGAVTRAGGASRLGAANQRTPGRYPGSSPFARTGRQPQRPGTRPGGIGQREGATATGLINQLLTSPRPGGAAAAMGTAGQMPAAQVFERGIAGVASTSEDSGVMVYKGKSAFNEWEFVFDYREQAQAELARMGLNPQTGRGAADRARPQSRSVRGSSRSGSLGNRRSR